MWERKGRKLLGPGLSWPCLRQTLPQTLLLVLMTLGIHVSFLLVLTKGQTCLKDPAGNPLSGAAGQRSRTSARVSVELSAGALRKPQEHPGQAEFVGSRSLSRS